MRYKVIHGGAFLMITLRRLIALLALAGIIAACGVRGPPQPPPGASPQPSGDPFVLDPTIK
jgi:predicted small lipoprotein YifL